MSIPNYDMLLNEKYKIIRNLGSGTYSNVLKVSCVHSNKSYAIKIFNIGEQYKKSALLEYQILALLQQNNNHVVNVYEYFEINNHNNKCHSHN
jgi:serine/threonine protein kinase